MSRVITFSRVFPSYHPRKGEPTYFVEKFWKSLYETGAFQYMSEYGSAYNDAFPIQYLPEENIHYHHPKGHTIRAGNRFKAGDWFSPRVWGTNVNPKSGRSGPYHSNQIIIAPDIQIKKVWDIKVENTIFWLYNGKNLWNGLTYDEVGRIAANDGLSLKDFNDWFRYPRPFSGQIICWDESIEY